MSLAFRFLLALILIPNIGVAEIPSAEHKALEDFVANYKRMKTYGDFVEHVPISIGDYIFLKDKIAGIKNQKLPKIRLLQDSIQFDDNGDVTTLKVLSLEKRRFSLNNKIINLAGVQSPLDRWNLIEQAMPKSKTSMIEFLMPAAHANAWVGVVAVIVGLGASAVALYNSAQDVCRDNLMAYDDCERQLATVEIYTRASVGQVEKKKMGKAPVAKKKAESHQELVAGDAQQENWKEMVSLMKQGKCPLVPTNLSLDTETSKVMSSVLRTGETKTNKYIEKDCYEAARAKASECVERLAHVAKNICFQITTTVYETATGKKPSLDLSIPTEGTVPAANPEDAPPPSVKEVIKAESPGGTSTAPEVNSQPNPDEKTN